MYLDIFQLEMLEKNELKPLVTNGFSHTYHLNDSTFRGIRIFLSSFHFSSIFCEHLQWPQIGRHVSAVSHLWPLKNVPSSNGHLNTFQKEI